LAKNPLAHGRSKHIEAKFHYLKDQVYKKKIELIHCRSEVQPNDLLTKSMKIRRFFKLKDKLGVISKMKLN